MIARTGALKCIRRGGRAPALPVEGLIAAWLPETLSGADGDAVATWPDASGHGYDLAQSDGARQPVALAGAVNGKKAIGMSGQKWMALPDSLTVTMNDLTVLMVAARGLAENNRDLLGFGAANAILYRMLGTAGNWPPEKVQILTGGGQVCTLPLPSGFMLHGFTIKPTTRVFHTGDGDSPVTVSTSATAVTGGKLNPNCISYPQFDWQGAVAEILVYHALETAGLAAVRGYLNAKYALHHGPFTKQVAFDGHSWVAGVGSTNGRNFPNQVIAALAANVAGFNCGIGSRTTTQMIADAATKVDPLYNASYTANVVVPMEIRNDVVLNGKTREQAYDNYVAYCQARRAVGWKVVAVTVPAIGGFYGTNRSWVNAQIRANWQSFADALADPAADTRIGDDNDNTDLAYYIADGVHMNSTGYGVLAGAVAAAVNGLL